MIQNPTLQRSIKALLLIGLSLFLYSRIANGTLTYYIAERFAAFTLIAIVGLVLVGVSYHMGQEAKKKEVHQHDDADEHEHDHAHEHEQHHSHAHALSFSGMLLIALPVILGVVVPPQPLGAAALHNRELTIVSNSSAMPIAVRKAGQKSALERNILDWHNSFKLANDAATDFVGEPARVVGFVFRDERFAQDQFFVARFTLSCCVADSSVVGLVVRTEQAAVLETDQWVEVEGSFVTGSFDGKPAPMLVASKITQVDVPDQPYLYP